MDLHAVHTGLLAQGGGFGEGFNDLPDLRHRQCRGGDLRIPTGGQGTGAGQLPAGVDDRPHQGAQHLVLVYRSQLVGDGPAAAHSGGELNKELGPGFVDLIHKHLQVIKHLFILPQPFPPEGIPQGGNAGNDQAHVVLRPLQEKGGGLLIKFAAGQFKPTKQGGTAHGTQHNAVLDLHIADLPGGKKRFVFDIHRCIHSFVQI